MSHLREAWTRSVADALEAHAVAVAQMAPGHWTFAPAASPALRVGARIAGEWLLFDTSLPAHVSRTLDWRWKALAANQLFAGGVKLCTVDGERTLRLRAELPLLEDAPVASRVRHVCAGIAAATAWLTSRTADARPAPIAADHFEASDLDLPELCRETQWPLTVREPNTVMVQLDVPGTFQRAMVDTQTGRGVVVFTPILSEAPRAPVCEAAVARLLLAATGAVRMVRAVAGVSPASVGFEVVFAHIPTAEELVHTFAALSVAWSCAGREAEVLARDERIARLYAGDEVKQQSNEVFESSTT